MKKHLYLFLIAVLFFGKSYAQDSLFLPEMIFDRYSFSFKTNHLLLFSGSSGDGKAYYALLLPEIAKTNDSVRNAILSEDFMKNIISLRFQTKDFPFNEVPESPLEEHALYYSIITKRYRLNSKIQNNGIKEMYVRQEQFEDPSIHGRPGPFCIDFVIQNGKKLKYFRCYADIFNPIETSTFSKNDVIQLFQHLSITKAKASQIPKNKQNSPVIQRNF